MQREMFKQLKREFTSSTLTKYAALLLLLVLSIAVVACGASGGNSATAAAPSPTAQPIHLDNNNLSPTPTLPANFCGIWIPDPSIPAGSSFMVYGKFTQNSNGNPVGMPGGTATLNIQWGDGTPQQVPATISGTGLMSIGISSAGHPGAINRLSLITATFTSGNATCQVGDDRPASFTLVAGAAPKSTTTTTTGGGNGGNNGFPGNGRKHG